MENEEEFDDKLVEQKQIIEKLKTRRVKPDKIEIKYKFSVKTMAPYRVS